MNNKNNYLNKFKLFIENRWFLINVLFIIILIIFFVYKHYFNKGYTFGNSVDSELNFDPSAFLLMLAGIGAMALSYFYYKKNIIIGALLIVGYLLISFGYIKQKNPDMENPWGDVAVYNYDAGVEFAEKGPLYFISTWNERVNPYINDGNHQEVKLIMIDWINKYKLNWISGDRWTGKKLEVSRSNNRAWQHPPLVPMLIGGWFLIFPQSKWSLQIFTIIIYVSVLIIFLIFIFRRGYFRNKHFILFALFTTPSLILFNDPSAEPASMFLIFLSVMMLLLNNKNNFRNSFISGILICLGFYTKFILGFYILFQFIALILFYKKLSLKPALGYLTGIIVVNLIFILSGYYFWLNALAGSAFTKIYITENPVSDFKVITDLLYYGCSTLLIILLSFIYLLKGEYKVKDKIIILPLLAGILISIISLWNLGTMNRYLTIFIPCLLFYAYIIISDMNIQKKDTLVIPFVNMLFFFLIVYF